ncbi:MAG: phosphoribosylglycinamide formyltransferase, partial [Burkholderiales bacterium]
MRSGVILISGRGSNMRSIVEARTGLDVRAVISNRPDAGGLEWARSQGIPAIALDHKAHASREAF